jgi:hypothetical protein
MRRRTGRPTTRSSSASGRRTHQEVNFASASATTRLHRGATGEAHERCASSMRRTNRGPVTSARGAPLARYSKNSRLASACFRFFRALLVNNPANLRYLWVTSLEVTGGAETRRAVCRRRPRRRAGQVREGRARWHAGASEQVGEILQVLHRGDRARRDLP